MGVELRMEMAFVLMGRDQFLELEVFIVECRFFGQMGLEFGDTILWLGTR